MRISRHLTILLFCTLGTCAAQAEESTQANTTSGTHSSSSSVIDKTGHAIDKGAKATANGAEFVAKKVVHGLETGAHATERAFNSAASAVGIHETGSHSNNGSGATPATKPAPVETSASH